MTVYTAVVSSYAALEERLCRSSFLFLTTAAAAAAANTPVHSYHQMQAGKIAGE